MMKGHGSANASQTSQLAGYNVAIFFHRDDKDIRAYFIPGRTKKLTYLKKTT